MAGDLTASIMMGALQALDGFLQKKMTLIMGGGGAMILAHGYPRGTTDIDAIPKGMNLSTLDTHVKQVAEKLSLPLDWLNPYFATFSHTLPSDYEQRLISVFSGKNLEVLALGKEEMLIMKCFAHRQKDVPHAKSLILGGANLKQVEARIEELIGKRIPGAEKALEFLDDVLDQVQS